MVEAEAAAGTSHATVAALWLVFVAGVSAAAAVDLLLVSRLPPEGAEDAVRQPPVYVRQILFWLAAAALFNGFVWATLGGDPAVAWLYGYVLEYALSFDNLFVFQVVFRVYSTPSAQVDRALFWGISAAVVLRLLFFGVGTEILSMGLIARLFFGLALVYSGVKTLKSGEEDEDDPTQNPVVKCVAHLLPVHSSYSEDASFFIRVRDGDGLNDPSPTSFGQSQFDLEMAEIMGRRRVEASSGGAGAGALELPKVAPLGTARELRSPRSDPGQQKLKVTLLFLVVVTLGIIDVIFAVDSVTAKISSVASFGTDLNFFLNLTSSALAMFMLKSLYVLIDTLVQSFRYLKYGVGIVLILIGFKLMLSGYAEVGMVASCLAILAILLMSILLSVLIPQHEDTEEAEKQRQHEAGDADAVDSALFVIHDDVLAGEEAFREVELSLQNSIGGAGSMEAQGNELTGFEPDDLAEVGGMPYAKGRSGALGDAARGSRWSASGDEDVAEAL